MVKLPPADQARLILAEPEVFRPASGAWGRGGATVVTLRGARVAAVRGALSAAWRHTIPKELARAFAEEGPAVLMIQGATRASRSGGAGKRKGSSNSSPRKREPR